MRFGEWHLNKTIAGDYWGTDVVGTPFLVIVRSIAGDRWVLDIRDKQATDNGHDKQVIATHMMQLVRNLPMEDTLKEAQEWAVVHLLSELTDRIWEQERALFSQPVKIGK